MPRIPDGRFGMTGGRSCQCLTTELRSEQRSRCPDGESAEQMTARVDKVITHVREIHRKYKVDGVGRRDVMIVSHGLSQNSPPAYAVVALTWGIRQVTSLDA